MFSAAFCFQFGDFDILFEIHVQRCLLFGVVLSSFRQHYFFDRFLSTTSCLHMSQAKLLQTVKQNVEKNFS